MAIDELLNEHEQSEQVRNWLRGNAVGLIGGVMNMAGSVGGITVPILVGIIVQATGSYFMALMLFTAAGVGLFICSALLIDYRNKIPV